MTKKILLEIICALNLITTITAQEQEMQENSAPASKWVFYGKDGRLCYKEDEKRNRIPDFSQAGYRTGTVPLPGTKEGVEVPVQAELSPAEGDQTARIQQAINQVSSLKPDANGFRGAVLLKKGEYPVVGTLFIRSSGVVLRGEGSGEKEGTIIRATGKDKRVVIRIQGSGAPDNVSGKIYQVTDDYVPVGSLSFSVDDPAGLKVGDSIIIHRPSPANWIRDIGMDEAKRNWVPGFADIKWDRIITGISGNKITVDAPITTAIEAKYGGATVFAYSWPGRIRECGIEHIRAVSDYSSKTDEEHAWTFIVLDKAENLFVRDVIAQHFAYATVGVEKTVKWVTIEDSQCLDPISLVQGGRRYSFTVSGQMVLVRNCYTRLGRHDFVCNDYFIAGPNVFVDCKAEKALSELGPHRQWSSGILLDNIATDDRISLYNRRDLKPRTGSSRGHGWASANCIAWNCYVAKLLLVEHPPTARNWAIGCVSGKKQGDGTFDSWGKYVNIRSLYYAQLKERMNNETLNNKTP